MENWILNLGAMWNEGFHELCNVAFYNEMWDKLIFLWCPQGSKKTRYFSIISNNPIQFSENISLIHQLCNHSQSIFFIIVFVWRYEIWKSISIDGRIVHRTWGLNRLIVLIRLIFIDPTLAALKNNRFT